jgi:hypothetical protein
MIMIRMAKHVPRPLKRRRTRPSKPSGMKKKSGPGAAPLASEHDSQGRKLKRQLTGELRQQVFPRLKSLGVSHIKVEYSGYGNTRAINYVEYFNAGDEPVDVSSGWPACSPIIEHIVHEFLPENFETGQGGQGDVTINIDAKTLTVEHEENYVAVRESTREFDL